MLEQNMEEPSSKVNVFDSADTPLDCIHMPPMTHQDHDYPARMSENLRSIELFLTSLLPTSEASQYTTGGPHLSLTETPLQQKKRMTERVALVAAKEASKILSKKGFVVKGLSKQWSYERVDRKRYHSF